MLFWAVYNSHIAIVKELFLQDAINFDINDNSKYPIALLTFAAKEGFISIVKILLCHSANPNA
jgi:ankyrin repeat protein